MILCLTSPTIAEMEMTNTAIVDHSFVCWFADIPLTYCLWTSVWMSDIRLPSFQEGLRKCNNYMSLKLDQMIWGYTEVGDTILAFTTYLPRNSSSESGGLHCCHLTNVLPWFDHIYCASEDLSHYVVAFASELLTIPVYFNWFQVWPNLWTCSGDY